jgi:hypothetical protein
MKSNQLNSSEQPPAMSVSNSRNNPCLGHDSNAAAVAFLTDDGISYLLPYAQLLYAERMANPALEKGPEASPEKMSIHFGCAEVIVLGSGLKQLENWLQKNELSFVMSADSRLDDVCRALITAVTVTLTKENV